MGLTEIGRNHGTAPSDWYDYRQLINALRGRQEIVFSHAWHSYGDRYGYELHAVADHHYLWEALNDSVVANLGDIVLPPAASSSSVEGTIRIRNRWTGQYLNASGESSGSSVVTYADNPVYWSQQWVVEPTDNSDLVRLRCRWGSNYLHAIGTANSNYTPVKASQSANSIRQQWELERVEGNIYRIRNVFKNRYLNADQSGVLTSYDFQPTWHSQMWIIESAQ